MRTKQMFLQLEVKEVCFFFFKISSCRFEEQANMESHRAAWRRFCTVHTNRWPRACRWSRAVNESSGFPSVLSSSDEMVYFSDGEESVSTGLGEKVFLLSGKSSAGKQLWGRQTVVDSGCLSWTVTQTDSWREGGVELQAPPGVILY